MTQLLDWHNADDPRELLRQAIETLGRGGIVAFPTETVYILAVNAAGPKAVERLWQITGRGPERPLLVAVRDDVDALGWVPNLSALGSRLARRCWPGPVTLVFEDVGQGRVRQLPDEVQSRLGPTGTLSLACPAHDALQYLLEPESHPLIVSGAYRTGESPAVTATDVMSQFADTVELVLDDGPCRYGRLASVVQVRGETWQMVRPGIVPEALLRRQAALWIVFVCTGNTCRSPLAEALCKRLLAERLGCAPAELPDRGFLVLSAGLSAMMGGGAAGEAIEVARELGADLSNHRSRPLSAELMYQADCLLAMTQSHLDALISIYPELESRSRLLDPEGQDVPDPIGSEQAVYRECAGTIARLLESHVPGWLRMSFPSPDR
jgi:protein-tyrosine phosphatase